MKKMTTVRNCRSEGHVKRWAALYGLCQGRAYE